MKALRQCILIVDDHPKLMRFIELALKFRGFKVTTAGSGQDGLNAVSSVRPDIMLLDIRMPDMDGFEVLRQLRDFSQLPVIAYSATPEYSTRALRSGANAFIAKPFEIDQLVESISELLGDGPS